MNPLVRFGLPANADERAVKREYARRLKSVRPDEDPAGFQALHTEYQAALSHARARQQRAAASERVATESLRMHEDSAATPVASMHVRLDAWVPTVRLPIEPPVRETFDPEVFFTEFLERIAFDDEKSLAAWLETHPAWWSLERKAAGGHWMIERLADTLPAMRGTLFDVVLRFFGLDQVGHTGDMAWLLRLRERMHLKWQLGDMRSLRYFVNHRGGLQLSMAEISRALRQLTRPFNWFDAVLRGLLPRTPSICRDFALRLDGGRRELPPPIVPEQLAFWFAASDMTRWSWPRAAIGLLRAAICGVAFALLVGLMLGFDEFPALRTTGRFVLYTVAGYGAWLLLSVPVRSYFAWQAAPEHHETRWPWLRLLWVPVLACASVALMLALDNELWGILLGGVAVTTAIWRYAHRSGLQSSVAAYLLFGLLLMLLSPVLALVFWTRDAWRHRHVLRWRARASAVAR